MKDLKLIALAVVITIEILIIVKILYFDFSWSEKTFKYRCDKSEKLNDFYESSPKYGLILKKGYTGFDYGTVCKYKPVRIHINKFGMRDYDNISMKKEKNEIRIAVVGDSIDFGLGVDFQYIYPKVLEKMLNEKCKTKNKTFSVLDFAVPGYNLTQKIILINDKAVKFSPDIIIIGYTTDDVLIDYGKINKEIGKELDELKKRGEISQYQIYQTTQDIIRKNMKNVDDLPPEIIYKIMYDEFKKTENISIPIIIFYRVTNSYNQLVALKNISKTFNYTLIYGDTLTTLPIEMRVHPLDYHPNKKAHRLYANILFEILRNTYLSDYC